MARFSRDTARGTMNKKKLKKIQGKIRSLRAGSGNIRLHQITEVAGKLGRKPKDRGKHLTYESEQFPDLRPLPVPSHPVALNPITAENILDQLDEDCLRWEEYLNKGGDEG